MTISSQLSLIIEDDPSIEAAKRMIRPYVKRGDTLKELRAGQMGTTSPDSYSVSIGGYLNGKKYPTNKIIVERDMNGEEVNQVYSLEKLYKEIQGEQ